MPDDAFVSPPASSSPVDDGDHPHSIGPYRITGVLGEGGMGVVYLAEQSEPVRRQVALKVLKAGMDTKQVLARFESEKQSLALMEHPGIARVLDAGATEDGRPFFVMERVDGLPITDYCDARALDLRARVRLLLQVCRAVQHAHQKGVIHRDLKPSNVLVTESDGRPHSKVIDFGLARAVEPDALASTRITQLDQSLGTPAYMSPEQVEGSLDIDTRTDIYALGVLLYELLSGELPFEAAAYHGWALRTQRLTRDVPLPSARFRGLPEPLQAQLAAHRGGTSDVVRRGLRGDLDWITLRALEYERDRRYATPESLAQDLERHLSHEPVLASPPSRAYRARKFVRRHRTSVAFAAVLTLLIVGFAGAMGVQAERIAVARDQAVVRRGQAEQLIDFMLGDLRTKLEPIGRLELLDDVGDQAVAYFATLSAGDFSDTDLLNRSRALSQIGQVRLNEGRTAESMAALRESLRLAVALSARAPDDADRLYQLSQSHFWVGYAAWRQRELAAAETEFAGYLAAAERMVALQPDNLDYRMELGFAHSNLGSVREARGDLDGAADAFRLTLGVKQDLVRTDSTRVDWLGELAETHNTLAVVYRKQGRYADALDHHRRELLLKQRLLELQPGHAYWRFRMGSTHGFLGTLSSVMGDGDGALAGARAAVATVDSLTRHDPANAEWRRNLALLQRQLGQAHAGRVLRAGAAHGSTRDGITEAAAALTAAQRLLEELLRGDSTNLAWRADLGTVHAASARLLLATQQVDAAVVAATRAVETLTAAAAAERQPQRLAEAELVLAQALQRAGRTAEGATVVNTVLDRLDTERRALDTARRERSASQQDRPDARGGRDDAELRPLFAEAYLLAGRTTDARRELDILRSDGYAEPFLVALAAARGVPLTR
jgi:eukaryotic-like serine/threonine-protein kinase